MERIIYLGNTEYILWNVSYFAIILELYTIYIIFALFKIIPPNGYDWINFFNLNNL